jgi:hypothetical protein
MLVHAMLHVVCPDQTDPARPTRAMMHNHSLFINAQYSKLLFNACNPYVKVVAIVPKRGIVEESRKYSDVYARSDPVTSFEERIVL